MKKQFNLETVMSLITRKAFNKFDLTHEAAEHLLGCSIWTHEFAEMAIWDRLKAAVLKQHPQFQDLPDASAVKDEPTARQFLADVAICFGPGPFEFERGSEERTEHPVDSLQRMMPQGEVIVVQSPDAR